MKLKNIPRFTTCSRYSTRFHVSNSRYPGLIEQTNVTQNIETHAGFISINENTFTQFVLTNNSDEPIIHPSQTPDDLAVTSIHSSCLYLDLISRSLSSQPRHDNWLINELVCARCAVFLQPWPPLHRAVVVCLEEGHIYHILQHCWSFAADNSKDILNTEYVLKCIQYLVPFVNKF